MAAATRRKRKPRSRRQAEGQRRSVTSVPKRMKRNIQTVLVERVPCSLSKDGYHKIKLEITQRRTVRRLSCECDSRALAADALDRLEGDCCLRVKRDILKYLLNKPSWQDNFGVDWSLLNRCYYLFTAADSIKSERNNNGRPAGDRVLDDARDLYTSLARLLQHKLNRGGFEGIVEISCASPRRYHLRIFNRNRRPVARFDGMWTLDFGEDTNVDAIDQHGLRRGDSKAGECPVCKHTYSDLLKHSVSKRHRKKTREIVIDAIRFLTPSATIVSGHLSMHGEG
jgi:hypothetical protein